MSKRAPAGLGRRARRSSPLRSLYLFSEGENPETQYIQAWARRHRTNVTVLIDSRFGLAPKTMVQAAVDYRRQAQRDDRRGRGRAPDEVWCVFDVDDHPSLREAMQQARDNQVHVALSAPCVELFMILHLHDQRSHISTDEATHKAKALLGCGKRLPLSVADELVASYDIARDRAIGLDLTHAENDVPFPANPGSGMYRLIDSIRGIGSE